jgi:hypothetical protein
VETEEKTKNQRKIYLIHRVAKSNLTYDPSHDSRRIKHSVAWYGERENDESVFCPKNKTSGTSSVRTIKRRNLLLYEKETTSPGSFTKLQAKCYRS